MLTVILSVCLILSGCGSKEAATEDKTKTQETEDQTNEERISVKISAINAVSWAPVFIAQTEGFFEGQEIEAEFTTPGGPKGFQAMHAGDCEFSMLSQERLLIAREQWMESKVVAAMLGSRVYRLISTPDITDISQLKGKTIFGSDAGSAPYIFVSNVLSMSGLDLLSDVSFVQVSDNNAGGL